MRSCGNQYASSSSSGGPSRETTASASMATPVRRDSSVIVACTPGRESIRVMSRSKPTVNGVLIMRSAYR